MYCGFAVCVVDICRPKGTYVLKREKNKAKINISPNCSFFYVLAHSSKLTKP